MILAEQAVHLRGSEYSHEGHTTVERCSAPAAHYRHRHQHAVVFTAEPAILTRSICSLGGPGQSLILWREWSLLSPSRSIVLLMALARTKSLAELRSFIHVTAITIASATISEPRVTIATVRRSQRYGLWPLQRFRRDERL